MRTLRLIPGLAVLALFAAAPQARAGTFSDLYAFGDSLSDAGNVFLATGGTVPAPPYAAGHFTNGPTWVENLAQDLGVGPLRPSLAGGNDYAFGGAVTGALPLPSPIPGIPNLSAQLGMFGAATGGHASSSALYSVWIGANDVFQAVDAVAGGLLTPGLAQGYLTTAAGIAAAAVQTLAGEGARSFLIPLVPDLGKTPRVNGNPLAAALATLLASGFNADLEKDIQALIAAQGISVTFVDTFSLLDAAVGDPAAFGFSNVSDPCYPGAIEGGSPACGDPDAYLFWDGLHPSERGHQAIAALARADLPEPGPLPLLALALAALTLFQRRTARPD